MGSVMEQVFEAMPLRAVRYNAGRIDVRDWRDADASKFRAYVDVHSPSAPAGRAAVRAPKVSEHQASAAPTTGSVSDIPLWSFKPTDRAGVIESISCLTHEDAYRDYLVLEELRFGRVTVFWANTRAELQLDNEHLIAVFRTKEVWNPANAIGRFPLWANYDPAIVYAFLFDIPTTLGVIDDPNAPPLDQTELALRPLRIKETDPEGWATLLQAIESFQAVAPPKDGKDPNDAVEGGSSHTVRSSLLVDDLWNPIDEEHWADVGDEPAEVRVAPMRVLVLASMTPCKEHDDYQPEGPFGGVAGMARLYPHVMVKATFPLKAIESALVLRRPERTTIRDGKPCGCPEMGTEIAPILVTDTNSEDSVLLPPPPHWDALFAYYQLNAHQRFTGKSLRIVDPTKTKKRKVHGVAYGNRGADKTRVTKLPRQGAFDNIHMAPKMKLPDNITKMGFIPTGIPGVFASTYTLDDLRQAGWDEALGDIVMAPICAHDCFHAHWRWTDSDAKARAVHGWDERGPHRVPGAPMVPLHHAVDLAILSAREIGVIERARWNDGRAIQSDSWEIFHYPGYAFGVWAGTTSLTTSKIGINAFSGGTFLDGDGNMVTALDSWAVFYFFVRYIGQGSLATGIPPLVYERVRPLVAIETLMEVG